MQWKFNIMQLQILVLVVVAICSIAQGKKIKQVDGDNCEVCVTFLTRFIDELDGATKSSTTKIEDAIRKKCKTTKKDDNRFCYYIGGLEESATGMLQELSKPISWSMPADKVCMKLYRMDEQICDLKYDKTMDLSIIDLKKLKVKDLKAILSDWDQQCRGCTEKHDFVNLIEELMPKYAPEAYAKRKKSEL